MPAEIVPQTHIKQQRSHAPPRGLGGDGGERRGGGRGGPRGDRGDREGGYRRREQGGEGKDGGAPGGFAPTFRGGYGAFVVGFEASSAVLIGRRSWSWCGSPFVVFGVPFFS